VEVVAVKVQRGHLLVGDLDARLVVGFVEVGIDLQAGAGGRRGAQTDNRLAAGR
jgi:hypothetical protein